MYHARPNKKMKMEKITSSTSVDKEILSDIVFEVLARLPIKALDRFKCVSKSWSSMISHPEFMKAHRPCAGIFINLFPGSCFFNPNPKGLFYASIHGNDEVFVRRLSLPYCGYEDITPIINGLACLYTGYLVALFNVSTRELMELPSSSSHDDARYGSCALGFDPVDNVYKLVKISTIFANRLVYKILRLKTSSRSTWRWSREIVQEGLPWFPFSKVQCYSVNGIIYCEIKEYLLAFDVHQEHFTVFNPPRLDPSTFNTIFCQFEGRLAIARKTRPKTLLNVWALEDYQNSIWSKHSINMPDELVRELCEFTSIGNLPSGELLLCGMTNGSFFIYDPISKKFTKLMDELPYSLYYLQNFTSGHITFLMEKITPLHDLVGLREDE